MKLWLMRHAHAAPGRPMNPSREITDKGRAQCELMGNFMKAHLGTVDLILCSEFRRAVQTAQLMSQHLGARYIKVPQLAPDGIAIKMWNAILQAVDRKREILVVTHDPAILELFAWLTGGAASQVRFEHATIAHIDIKDPEPDAIPKGVFHWQLEPKLIEGYTLDRDVAEAAVALALTGGV
jgi:phosphohistidine phosphatase